MDSPPASSRQSFKPAHLILLGVSLVSFLGYMVYKSMDSKENLKIMRSLRAMDLACDRESQARSEDAADVLGRDGAGLAHDPENGRDLPESSMAELSEVLDSTRCRAMSCAGLHYRIYPVDLNADGALEYVVEGTDCGSGGCDVALFIRSQGKWVKLAGIFGALFVEDTKTNGYRDLTVSYKDYPGGGRCEIKRVHLAWDGRLKYKPSYGAEGLEPAKRSVRPLQSRSLSTERSNQASNPHPLLTQQGDRHCYDFPGRCSLWPEVKSGS